MIDLYKLNIFHQVVEAGSFSAAAERLYVTQSAISQHIKDLELALGQVLFVRERRGVRLTSAGETLAGYTRQIFSLLSAAETALTNIDQLTEGKVSLGASAAIGIYRVPIWVQMFRARYPHITVALQTGVTAQIVGEVLSHHLDVGIVEGELDGFPSPHLAFTDLEAVEQLVVIGIHHPFWERDTLDLTDLSQRQFIVRQQGSQSRSWFEQVMRTKGINPIIGAEFDNLESIKRAVSAGSCLAIMPAYVVENEIERDQLRAISVVGKPLMRTLKLIWDKRIPFSPVTRAFLAELSESYPILHSLTDR